MYWELIMKMGFKIESENENEKRHGLTAQALTVLWFQRPPIWHLTCLFTLCLQTEYTVAHYISIFSSFCFSTPKLFWSTILINHAHILSFTKLFGLFLSKISFSFLTKMLSLIILFYLNQFHEFFSFFFVLCFSAKSCTLM